MQIIHNVKAFIQGSLTDASIAFEDGFITHIFKNPNEAESFIASFPGIQITDGKGLLLLPGAIDAHVHFREPGLTQKADISSESRAAAAGGITTVFDMPNVKPTTTTPEALAEKDALFAAKSVVNYGLFYGITTSNIDEALALPQSLICGYKVFLGSSTGGMLMNDSSLLRHLMSHTSRVIAVHSESEELIRQQAEHYRSLYGDNVPVNCHPLIRNAEACYKTTSEAIKLAKETGAHLHVCHLTTAQELELFSEGPISDKQITAEACVAHLWFSDEDYDRLGARIKCNPAIKSIHDREELRNALRRQRIDTVATDHAPHLPSDKEGGALKAASGMPSIQYSLLSMLELVHDGIISITDLVRLMSENPAQLFKLQKRGTIAIGQYADLVLIDPAGTTFVDKGQILSKCGWSPFEGVTFHHRIAGTWVNGHKVFDGVRILSDAGGQRVVFDN